MEQKSLKTVTGRKNASTIAFREFGSKVFTMKPLMKISTLFSNKDKTIMNKARVIIVETQRWFGEILRPQLTNLQPVPVRELEAPYSQNDAQNAVPVRYSYIRSEQQKQNIPVAVSEEVDTGGTDEEDLIDILFQLPKDFYEKMEAKKWQERKEALESLERLVTTPKLPNGDYADLIQLLKIVIEKDSNVVVVALAGRCLASIAVGLKNGFQPYAASCIPSLLDKFKENKQNVVAAVKDAIDAMYLTTTMEVIADDVVQALGNKNPSVKVETSFFLARCFTKTPPTVFNKKMLKLLTTALPKNINESDSTVRDSSAEALGTLMKLVGEKAVGPFLVELEKDNIKLTKIKECCEKAVITVKVTDVKKERPITAPTKTASESAKGTTASGSKSAPTKANAPNKKKPEVNNSNTVVRSKNTLF